MRNHSIIVFAFLLLGNSFGSAQMSQAPGCAPECPAPPHAPPGPSGYGVGFMPEPTELLVSQIPGVIDASYISDVETLDFNQDGRLDIAVAWFKTDFENINNYARMVTIFYNQGANQYVRGPDINLFVLDPIILKRSVFYNGTSELVVGDFDGDHDMDLAALPNFGDEVWFIENLGGGNYAKYSKWIFGVNTTGQAITPPDAAAADFDGDGRQDLVYIVDGVNRVDPYIIHFWRTSSTISAMQRANWEYVPSESVNGFTGTYGLAVGDWDFDGRPDLAFTSWDLITGAPYLSLWYKLNTQTARFAGHIEYPTFRCSDVAPYMAVPNCRPGLLLADLNGSRMQYWVATSCGALVDFQAASDVFGYASLSPNRGMTIKAADLDGDYITDVVTKQMSGDAVDDNQVEITLAAQAPGGVQWNLLNPSPISSEGFEMNEDDNILRPRALAIADLCGNTKPEIIAGFGASPKRSGPGPKELRVAIWLNGCVGDASRDGTTTLEDLAAVLAAFDCEGGPAYDPDADLNKDGCVDAADLAIAIADLGNCVPE